MQAGTPASSLQQPSFRSDVELVVVDVSVTNRSRSVHGLEPADFQLLDNGVPQRIDLLSADTVPIDVSVIVDISSSIGNNSSRFNDGRSYASRTSFVRMTRLALLDRFGTVEGGLLSPIANAARDGW